MAMGAQLAAFDVPPEKAGRFRIYHDERGTDTAHARFQLHGALIVDESRWQRGLEALLTARGGYAGRIHFVELRDNARTPSSGSRVNGQVL
jgi:hypothetical protein